MPAHNATPRRAAIENLVWDLTRDGIGATRIAAEVLETFNENLSRSAVLGIRKRERDRRLSRGEEVPKLQGPVARTRSAPVVNPSPLGKTIFNPPKVAAPPVLKASELEPLGKPEEMLLNACPFLYGDVRTPGWQMCGREVVRGSYCEGHAALCYVKPAPRPKAASPSAPGPRGRL
jgi:hypothetical protein